MLQNLERPSHVKFNTHETDTPINQHRDFTTHPPLLTKWNVKHPRGMGI